MEQSTEEGYQRFRAFLDEKPSDERRAFLEKVSEIMGLIQSPPLQETDYIGFEESYADLVSRVNRRGARVLDTEDVSSELLVMLDQMKEMLDSPFKYYNNEVVSLIPDVRMTEEQLRDFQFIKAAVDFDGVRVLVREGVPLRLSRDDDRLLVRIGARSIRGNGATLYNGYVELDRVTGAPLSFVGP